MNAFNLLSNPWIPVRLTDGTRTELSLTDTLLTCRQIARIEDPSPLVTMALYRLLLAVLYRALNGPATFDEARHISIDGLPQDRIAHYLQQWHHRFNLFDPQYPFAQHAAFIPNHPRPWTALAAEHNADTAKVLFDHTDVRQPGAIPYARAARLLLATQTFAISTGKSELSHTSTAPSATAAMILPLGQTLEDTLLFSLVPQSSDISRHDLPLWEQEAESLENLQRGIRRPVTGWASLYTWPSRTIRLLEHPGNQTAELGFASGIRSDMTDRRDPMVAYRLHDKHGILPLQLRERGLWREFDALLPHDSALSPAVITHAIALTQKNPARFPHSLLVAGQLNLAGKAKLEFWRLEQYTLPRACLETPAIRTHIHDLLELAENTHKALWSACRTYARHLLSRGDSDPAPEQLKACLAQIPALRAYWSSLETHFHTLLHHYRSQHATAAITRDWAHAVQTTFLDCWDQHTQSLRHSDARGLRALAKATPLIDRHQHQLQAFTESAEQKENAA